MASNELVITKQTPDSDILNWAKAMLQPSTKYVLKRNKWQKNRTLDQNAQSHVWYEQLAQEIKDDNEIGWKRFCKLHFGVPILRASDSEFRELYDKCILKHLSYEQKLKAMDVLPVTSRMKTEQFNQYFEALQNHFSKQGVNLEFLK